MRARLLIPLLAGTAAMPSRLVAQLDVARTTAITGAEFRTVTFGAGLGVKTISEFAVPLGFSIPVSRRIAFDVGTYFVSAKRTDEADSSTTISGLTDVVIRSAFQLKPDVAVFTLSVNVPTGKKTLDGNQDLIARNVATDLIPFPVSNFGTGFSVTSGLALAAPVGSWALGLAGSYRLNSSYLPFEGDTTTLKPGGEVRVRVGADRIVGQGRVSLGLTYSTFSNDEIGGQSRSPGSRIIPQASLSLPMGNNSLSFYAWDVFRNYKVATTAKENTIAAGALMAIRFGSNSFRPMIEFRHSFKGGENNGTLFGVGARYAITGSRVSITPGFRFDFGSVPPGAAAAGVSFTGLSASLAIRSTF